MRRRERDRPVDSVETHPLVPMRNMGGEAELADLRLERELALRIAMDQEDATRVARIARPLAGGEVAEPIEQLALVGVRREPADRTDLAAHAPDLAVELDLGRPGLEVRPERPFALVADEQDRGGRVVDEVAQVAD